MSKKTHYWDALFAHAAEIVTHYDITGELPDYLDERGIPVLRAMLAKEASGLG